MADEARDYTSSFVEKEGFNSSVSTDVAHGPAEDLENSQTPDSRIWSPFRILWITSRGDMAPYLCRIEGKFKDGIGRKHMLVAHILKLVSCGGSRYSFKYLSLPAALSHFSLILPPYLTVSAC